MEFVDTTNIPLIIKKLGNLEIGGSRYHVTGPKFDSGFTKVTQLFIPSGLIKRVPDLLGK